jgi:NADH dehydrogenase
MTHRVVIIGSGFGGLFAAQALRKAPVEITLIAKTSHHLFQPLLYQVATGILSPGEIAPATREVLRHQKNARVILGEVIAFDLSAKRVTAKAPSGSYSVDYDSLIIAVGASQSYFGNDHFAQFAPGMKSIDDALELRGRIFTSFELAEISDDPTEIDRLTTFVVIGAGPTGVEMAGQIAELAHKTLVSDFRKIKTSATRVILLDAAPTMLGNFGKRLSEKAKKQLERLGVEIRLDTKVVGIDDKGLDLRMSNGTPERIEASCKIWAAGVMANPLTKTLAEQSGAQLDSAGRILVQPDCTLPGHSEVFVIGDMMALNGFPGVAQVAIQGGRFAAKQIIRNLHSDTAHKPFMYRDKGSMVTVSKFYAIAKIGRFHAAGIFAWIGWLVVHIMYLTGFKHRVTTLLHWAISFVGSGRAERVITEQQVIARNAIERLGDEVPNPYSVHENFDRQ